LHPADFDWLIGYAGKGAHCCARRQGDHRDADCNAKARTTPIAARIALTAARGDVVLGPAIQGHHGNNPFRNGLRFGLVLLVGGRASRSPQI